MCLRKVCAILIGLVISVSSQTVYAQDETDDVDITGVYYDVQQIPSTDKKALAHSGFDSKQMAYIYYDVENEDYVFGFEDKLFRSADTLKLINKNDYMNSFDPADMSSYSWRDCDFAGDLMFVDNEGMRLLVNIFIYMKEMYSYSGHYTTPLVEIMIYKLDAMGKKIDGKRVGFYRFLYLYSDIEMLGPFTGEFCGVNEDDDHVCIKGIYQQGAEGWVSGSCAASGGEQPCPKIGDRIEYNVQVSFRFDPENKAFTIENHLDDFRPMDAAYYAEKKVTERQLKLLQLLNGRWAALKEGDTSEYVFAVAKPEGGSILPKQLEFAIFAKDRSGRMIPLPISHMKLNIIEITYDSVMVQAEAGKGGEEHPPLQLQHVGDGMFYMRGPDLNEGFFLVGD